MYQPARSAPFAARDKGLFTITMGTPPRHLPAWIAMANPGETFDYQPTR